MMRYVFLIFLLFSAFAINFQVFNQDLSGASLLLTAVAANLFLTSLFFLWLGAYLNWFRRAGFLIWGHAVLFLSAGTGFFVLGYHSIISRSCSFLVSNDHSPNMISRVASWAVKNNFCSWLGMAFIIFGIFMAWPSLKLFWGFVRPKST